MDLPTGPLMATTLAGPVGPIHVACSERGVVAVAVRTTAEDFEAELQRRLRRPVAWSFRRAGLGQPLARAAAAIEAMIDRPGIAAQALLDAVALDLEDRPAWDRAVLDAVRSIPRGQVRSYGEVARSIGRPGAARAVGGAVGRNPVSMLVPCHRVVAGDGTLGWYGGGWWGDAERNIELKATLLAAEGVRLPRSRSRADRGR
ncbi:MAG TPA: MGMT family protein [Candidatus Limnocylindrales bacterium]